MGAKVVVSENILSYGDAYKLPRVGLHIFNINYLIASSLLLVAYIIR